MPEMLSPNYQLNLSDFALFLSVMKVKEAYEDVLSIILDEHDLRLKEVKAEQVILNKSGKRAIRLDAWALDRIVEEVKQSEEWEAVSMNILDIGIEQGIEQGNAHTLIKNVESLMKNFNIDLHRACEGLGVTVEEYESAKELITMRKNPEINKKGTVE